jgi:flagellin
MSGIVLSASVRQSTAAPLATTQNDFRHRQEGRFGSDNPISFFRPLGLDNRANDISNLLDAIGNGVQVLPPTPASPRRRN